MKVVILLQQQHWCVLLLFLLAAAAAAASPPPPPIAQPGCREQCGDTSVPYPFGIDKPKCWKNEDFKLDCDYSDAKEFDADTGRKERLRLGDFEISNISFLEGTATNYVSMANLCYDETGGEPRGSDHSMNLTGSPFTFSSKQNKFTALGCDTQATMMDGDGIRFTSGCMSLCLRQVNLADEEDEDSGCLGVGCCRTQIPKGVKTLHMSLNTFNNFTYVRDFSPCSFAFLADQNWNNYTRIDLNDTMNVTQMSPAVLDWVVGEETCESFSGNSDHSSNGCGANTYCNNSYNGPGYLCFCQNGYHGNPYLGCQDIDECMDPETYKCEGRCKNTEGNYTCHCPLGKSGDGKVGCKGFRLSTLVAALGLCLSFVVTIFFLLMECNRRNKARNFHKNGGSLLKHQRIMIFKEKELRKATKNYHPTHLLGRGGSGSVYKGELPDKSLVAIKKPNLDSDATRRVQPLRSRVEMNNEFQHEISMICQAKHKNVVKLLGLCLETNVPLLVYEFISNGSLFDHLHIARSPRLNSWRKRLSIAYETAEALGYLHSDAGTPMIHRDVKSMNILLDENFNAKVSDFGASVLIPLEKSVIISEVLGTKGYLDPEYLITGNLTVKSDVYSFGVVLMELLTSEKPVSKERSGEKVNFVQYFISSVERGTHSNVLNPGGFGDDCEEVEMEKVEAAAELAVRCLNRSGVERPHMREVAEDLGRLIKLGGEDNYGVVVDQSNMEEMERLVPYDTTDHTEMEMVSSSYERHYMIEL